MEPTTQLIALSVIVSAVVTGLVMMVVMFAISYLNYRRNRKSAEEAFENLKGFMESKMREAQEENAFVPTKSGKETSTLTFRSTSGKMETVTIVVDYDLSDADAAKRVRELGAKKIDTGIKGCPAAEIGDGKDDFLFTGDSYRRIQMSGLTLEGVVKRLLVGQGRMHDVEG